MFLHMSVCPQGEYLGRYPPGPGTPPWGQVHPPGPGTHPLGTRYTPLWTRCPLGTRYTTLLRTRCPRGPGTPPSPRTRYTTPAPGTPPAPGNPPRHQVPLGPGTHPLWDQVHPPRTSYTTPHPRRQLLLRTVCILLECILVLST